MSWIKISLISFLCLASVSFADRIEFFASSKAEAQLRLYPLLSQGGLAPLMGEFSLPSMERKPGLDGFTEISVAGMSSLGQLGRPSLPTTGTLIAVPDGYRAVLTLIDQNETTLQDTWVTPYQAKSRCDCNRAQSFKFDAESYTQSHLFPAESVELQTVGSLQSLKMVRVAIHPIQFNAADKSLRVVYRMRFKITFVSDGNLKTQNLPRALFHLAKNWTANGKLLADSIKSVEAQEKMLVISPQNLKEALRDFIQWKTQKGIVVDYVSFEQAGGTKESLKEFIRSYYQSQSLKPSYLLLVGNSSTLPPFMETTTTGGTEQIAASDYPYSLVEGSDPIPDLLYGRLLADNQEEVKTQTARWIAYEKSPENHPWYAQGSVIASDESGSGQSDEQYVTEISQNLKAHTYQKMDQFFQNEKTATTVNILSAVAEGRSWITYMGHGSGLSWASTNDYFDVEKLTRLSNDRLPFILDISCSNANYIKYPKPFAKAWVTLENSGKPAGAVAYYGGSVDISWDPPAIMAIGISKAHFEKPVHHLGGTVMAGQMYLSEKKGVGEEFLDNLRWYQLLGDPSLELRTSQPTPIKVSQSIEKQGKSTIVNLVVRKNSGEGVPGVIATISSGDQASSLASGRTNAEGRLTLQLKNSSQLSRGVITVSGYNLVTSITALGY